MLDSCDPASMTVATAASAPTSHVAVCRTRSEPAWYGFVVDTLGGSGAASGLGGSTRPASQAATRRIHAVMET
jgi:hypothetical protein